MEILQATRGIPELGLGELWRDFVILFYLFTWRHLKVRYKQALFGSAYRAPEGDVWIKVVGALTDAGTAERLATGQGWMATN